MELGIREGYALWAQSYDGESNPLIAIEEPHVEQLLRDHEFTRVLDLGAGTGRHSLRMAREGARVTALDITPEMLVVAEGMAEAEGLPLDVHLGSLEEPLPFCAETFDLVVCALTLTHVQELSQVTKEIHRVLVEGGKVLVTDFHPDSVAQGWRTEFSEGEMCHCLPNMPHSRADYLEAFGAAGLKASDVIDVPLREVPEGHFPDRVVERYGQVNLCLLLLGEKV